MLQMHLDARVLLKIKAALRADHDVGMRTRDFVALSGGHRGWAILITPNGDESRDIYISEIPLSVRDGSAFWANIYNRVLKTEGRSATYIPHEGSLATFIDELPALLRGYGNHITSIVAFKHGMHEHHQYHHGGLLREEMPTRTRESAVAKEIHHRNASKHAHKAIHTMRSRAQSRAAVAEMQRLSGVALPTSIENSIVDKTQGHNRR